MMAQAENRNFKNDRGGLIDLEFLVQYLVLANPNQNLVSITNTMDLLVQLFKNKCLNEKAFKYLKNAYLSYHQALHQNVLTAEQIDLTVPLRQVLQVMTDIYGE